MNHYYFIFAFFVSFFSQSQSFKGKVVSSENKSISDVYVLNLNNQSHAHSNYKGEFTLENTVSGDSISISHKSFEELRTVISENNSFILNTKPVSLREVVITNELNHLYEIAKIDIKTNPVNSPQELLRMVPGLFIGSTRWWRKSGTNFFKRF